MSERVCTKEDPYEEGEGADKVVHPDASEVSGTQEDGHPAGDAVRMRCPHCGVEWTKELPQ